MKTHTQWSIVVQLLFLHLSATLSCQSRPLLIVAHADDEILFGLPIFLTTPSSCRPHVVVLTVTHPSRVQQMQHAAQRYNFTFDSLDYPDGPTHHQFDTDKRIHHQLSSIITTGWSGIYTHGPTGEYGHPQHIQCSNVVTRLVLQGGSMDNAGQPPPLPMPLYYFAPQYDESFPSANHQAVTQVYPSESLPWSKYWHARLVPWYMYDIATAREICTTRGYEMWRSNCHVLALPQGSAEMKRKRTPPITPPPPSPPSPPPPPPPSHTITLGVVHYRPFTTPLSSFEVGFRSALDLLCKMNPSYKVVYLNIYNLEGTVPGSNKYNTIIQQYHAMDVLLIKSNWNWIPDTFIRNGLHVTSTQPKCLLISGVAPLPERDEDVQYYSALVYETEWYNTWQHLQQRHPNVHQAFGIDTHIMKKSVVKRIKTWDLIFVGWMASWKRLDLFVEKYQRMCQTALQQEKDTGVPVELPTALAVGKLDATEDSRAIVEMLEKNGVVVKSEVPYNELAGLIHRSKEMYIPSTIQGGGERAVLEGKACGVAVTVEPDNFKLLELIELEQVPSHLDYANALHEMLQSVVVKEVNMGERRRREL